MGNSISFESHPGYRAGRRDNKIEVGIAKWEEKALKLSSLLCVESAFRPFLTGLTSMYPSRPLKCNEVLGLQSTIGFI